MMMKNLVLVLGTAFNLSMSLSIATPAYAKQGSWTHYRGGENHGGQKEQHDSTGKTPSSDEAIVRAVESQKNLHFVEGGGMVVSEILPDDTKGLRHQKFVVQLSNGAKMLAVYNLDMENCDPVPVRTGDTVAMGGEFKWTKQGGLLHWLHFDPKNKRPDGYIQHDGVDYCRTGERQ